MTQKKFGYVRVSSKDQNEGRQLEKFKELGIGEREIFIDKLSGKNFERPKYQLLKEMVRKGDTIVFDSITRMGRNMKDTMREYEWFVENGINLVFIKEPMINTDHEQDDIMKHAIQKIILTLLTAFAEKEREDIKIRQREGIDLALKNGVKLGRPKTNVINDEFIKAYDRWKAGEIKAVEAMKEANLSKTAFYRLVRLHEGR